MGVKCYLHSFFDYLNESKNLIYIVQQFIKYMVSVKTSIANRYKDSLSKNEKEKLATLLDKLIDINMKSIKNYSITNNIPLIDLSTNTNNFSRQIFKKLNQQPYDKVKKTTNYADRKEVILSHVLRCINIQINYNFFILIIAIIVIIFLYTARIYIQIISC